MSHAALILIQSTCDQRAVLETIASQLVAERLVACAQISGPIRSIYVWQGQTENQEEWLLTAKTSADLFDATERRIRELHPYQVPEILGLPVLSVSDAYRTWVLGQIRT